MLRVLYFIQAYLCCESLRRRLMKRQKGPFVAGQFVQLIDFSMSLFSAITSIKIRMLIGGDKYCI